MWPICRFSGQAQQPSDSRYLRFLGQLGKRCECWPVIITNVIIIIFIALGSKDPEG